MTSKIDPFVVRIRSEGSKEAPIYGAGFLVSRKRILTCAHVITEALKISRDTIQMPVQHVYVDFPLIEPNKFLKAHVIFWVPVTSEGEGDIAGLQLDDRPPKGAQRAHLKTADDFWGHKARGFGFPKGHYKGVYVPAILRGKITGGWLQIEGEREITYWVERGFSGAPVWDDDQTVNGVVGMVVAYETTPGVKAAYVIPTDLLVKAWPDLYTTLERPTKVTDWINEGDVFRGQGKYEEALKSYEKAIDLDPQNAMAWNNKGLALGLSGKHKEALESFDKSIELDPKNATVWNNKGVTLGSSGKHYEALKSYDMSIFLDPNNAVTWNNKGLALGALGAAIGSLEKYMEAQFSFERSIAIDPKNSMAWTNKGLALVLSGNHKGALKSFNKSIELDPKNALAWLCKGYVLTENYKRLFEGRFPFVRPDAHPELPSLDRLAAPQRLPLYDPYRFENKEAERNLYGALNAYNKAIELNPMNVILALAWNSKSKVLDALNRTFEAHLAFDKSKEIYYASLKTPPQFFLDSLVPQMDYRSLIRCGYLVYQSYIPHSGP